MTTNSFFFRFFTILIVCSVMVSSQANPIETETFTLTVFQTKTVTAPCPLITTTIAERFPIPTTAQIPIRNGCEEQPQPKVEKFEKCTHGERKCHGPCFFETCLFNSKCIIQRVASGTHCLQNGTSILLIHEKNS
ncbi:hypothetical protein HMI54_010688 [Coelomomyces lativittatus]|nr:hypothetical protein HMI54_010688 [Coelomomyces lativittatus]